ncbi:hypothetical protein Hanom_Chr07g00662801 [Helianthus anomalus]
MPWRCHICLHLCLVSWPLYSQPIPMPLSYQHYDICLDHFVLHCHFCSLWNNSLT